MTPLYQRLLGDRYTVLPPEVQALHDVRGTLVAEGRATVRRGRGLGGLLAAVLSLPPAGADLPVRVTFTADGDREIWTRRFGGRVFRSVQWIEDGCVVERLPLGGLLVFRVHAAPDALTLELVAVRAFGIPLTGLLRPEVLGEERVVDGRFQFHVRVRLRGIGFVVAYKGTLVPVAEA